MLPQSDFNVPEAAEPHCTFVENALAKARHASQLTGLPALADDSGICVDALGGAPGVGSAYYGGEPRSDERNNAHLLNALKNQQNRKAHYHCVMVLVRHPDDPQPLIAEGSWHGEVLTAPRGAMAALVTIPCFWIQKLGKTGAELALEIKNRISHRGVGAGSTHRKNKIHMMQLTSPPPLALYIHIRGCVRKCPYCDFNSHESRGEIPQRAYSDALIRDLEQALPLVWGRRISSIFFGGGTPSLFSAESIDQLLSGVRALLPINNNAEITLEANPGTVEAARFQGFKDAGVNRISLAYRASMTLT